MDYSQGDAFGLGSSSFLADMSHRLQTELLELQEERAALRRKHPNNPALSPSSAWQEQGTQNAFVTPARLVLLLNADVTVGWVQDICLKVSWHRQEQQAQSKGGGCMPPPNQQMQEAGEMQDLQGQTWKNNTRRWQKDRPKSNGKRKASSLGSNPLLVRGEHRSSVLGSPQHVPRCWH